jgi:hypothetical protein
MKHRKSPIATTSHCTRTSTSIRLNTPWSSVPEKLTANKLTAFLRVRTYYQDRKNSLMMSTLSRLNLVGRPTIIPLNFNITLPPTPRSASGLFHFWSSNRNFVCMSHIIHAFYTHRPPNPPQADQSSNYLLGHLAATQPVKNSPHFMELEGSPERSQKPAACPYPKPRQF